jgi:hypothetical protein
MSEEDTDEAEVSLPRRWEVHTIPLARKQRLSSFAEDFEYVLNEASNRGVTVKEIRFIEDRGAVVIIDTDTPQAIGFFPVPAGEVGALLKGLRGGSGLVLDERLNAALGSFSAIVQKDRLVPGSDKEYVSLRKHLQDSVAVEHAQELSDVLENCEAFMDEHQKMCSEPDTCDILRVLKLVHRALRENLKERLQ